MNRHESDLIRNIVKDVSDKLCPIRLYCPEHLVGIDSHVDNIIALLRIVTDDSRIVGIHGMGGIGKTTLAKVLFNLLVCEFEGSSFLSNVSERSKATNGLVHLQKQLLDDTLKTDNFVNNVDRGMILITERLRCKRVLVVLDDVDNEYQVKALVGENRFGPGSVIMVTSRNEHLLNRFTVHVKYEAKLLTQDESLQLFSWHAFRTIHPPDDYAELSNDVLKCAGGLPLALEVLGASLFGKHKSAWRSAIEKLRKTPDHDV
jgi:dephospho-CoA kinase